MSIEELSTLLRDYRICFDDSDDSSSWPHAHTSHFHNITQLGKGTIEAGFGSVTDPDGSLWMKRTKQRAHEIVARAEDLKRMNAKEGEWRFAIEDKLLARFAYEITW